jgi:uncharacterized membrane protein YphA (DoxX/SURF4 family)
MNVLAMLARLALGCIFLVAAAGKIVDPAALAKIIHNYRILPDVAVNLAALTLPWLEAVVGACLVTNCAKRGASLVTSLLMVVFLGAMAYAYTKGYDTQCGCFTTRADDPISPLTFARDGALLVLSLVVMTHSFLRPRDI